MGLYKKFLLDEVEYLQKYLQETDESEDNLYHQQMAAELKFSESRLDSLQCQQHRED